MSLCQINDMDVVTHARAVVRGVVVTPDIEIFAPPHSHLRHIGHQVVGNALWVFADQAAFVRTNGIEIAQYGNTPVWLSAIHIPQHVFNNKFAAPIWIGSR